MYDKRKEIVVGQHFSLETALRMHEKWFIILNHQITMKQLKNMIYFVSPSVLFGTKNRSTVSGNSLFDHYLNNRVFLSRNYWLIVGQRKFDVLKTNICPGSEASMANMLVLRTSNFQGVTIRPIVPRHKHSIVHRQSFFRAPVHAS